MTHRSFRGSHRRLRHRYNPSGYFYESIRQTLEVRGTSLKVEYQGQIRIYDSRKPIRIKERTEGF